jgi:exopolyphosphatase/guanosine-5'-triphosphate,3'-diphosphate pyrophosphatase
MPEIPDDRADMIVVALILVDLILRRANIEELTVSYYAMKEGMMYELLKKSRDESA